MSEKALQWPAVAIGIPESQAFKVLGVQVNAVQIPDVIARMEHWIDVYKRQAQRRRREDSH